MEKKANFSELDSFWLDFLKAKSLPEDTPCSTDIFFDSDGITNDSKIFSVLSGSKRAFFSSRSSYVINEEELPISGELCLLIDRAEKPVCVIEVQSVQIVPFCEVTWEMAKLEGEDSSIEEWRERQKEILSLEAEIVGFDFTEKMPLVFCIFEVVYKR